MLSSNANNIKFEFPTSFLLQVTPSKTMISKNTSHFLNSVMSESANSTGLET